MTGRTAPADRLTVLYDEDCGFCRWSVGRLLVLDRSGHLRPRPIQSEEGARLLAGMAPAQRLASAHVVAGDGRVGSGGDAVALVAATVVPVAEPLARALAPVSRVAYGFVAGHRSTLGRHVTPAMLRAADARIAAAQGGGDPEAVM